jgi:NADH-quinone oxidoreductase subunit D
VFLYTFQQREHVYNLAEQISGARFTTSYTRVGGQTRDISEKTLKEVGEFLDQLEPVIEEVDALLTRNKIFIDRTEGVGTVTKEDAISFGLTGPNLRGCGVDHDLRKANPYLGYEKYDFDVPIGSKGDSFDRYLVRMEEMRQSVKILRQVLANMPQGEINVVDPKNRLPRKERVMMNMEELIHHFIVATQGIDAPEGEVYFGAENPKGELGFYINSKGGGVPHRLKIRSPSFVNLSILPKMLPGHMMSDVVAILGSLDFVMGECDR